MNRAALGFQMHSGWGVLVAVSGQATPVEVIVRRRIVITDPEISGAKQPYHHAAGLGLPESEDYLAACAAASERLAIAAIGEVVRDLSAQHYLIVGSAVLLSSGRSLPSLSNILASHPLIHTAEGELFREAVRKACVGMNISVTAIRNRDLDEQATIAFGNEVSRVRLRLSRLGNSIGPPWTKDHKSAALAASIVLARNS
jgi:hypothetical protein